MNAVQNGPDADKFDVSADTTIKDYRKLEADTVVGQRVCLDNPTNLWQLWAKKGNVKLVYELDDYLFAVHRSNSKAWSTFNKSNIRENILRNIQVSHVVTVSTESLAEKVYQDTGHPDIRVVPNAVEPWVLDHEPTINYTFGAAVSPTHHDDYEPLRRHLKRFLDNNPEASAHFIGYDYGSHLGLADGQSYHTSWIKDPREAITTMDYSFGICPLVPSMFNRCKSSIKFLELAALGIPSIVSDIKAYDEVQHEVTGLKVKYDHEWNKTIRKMYEDPELRHSLGKAAKEYARTRTTEQTRELWQDAWT